MSWSVVVSLKTDRQSFLFMSGHLNKLLRLLALFVVRVCTVCMVVGLLASDFFPVFMANFISDYFNMHRCTLKNCCKRISVETLYQVPFYAVSTTH